LRQGTLWEIAFELSNSFIDFSGLFSIFEVQKQKYNQWLWDLMELEGVD
jgi:hypothetical protein